MRPGRITRVSATLLFFCSFIFASGHVAADSFVMRVDNARSYTGDSYDEERTLKARSEFLGQRWSFEFFSNGTMLRAGPRGKDQVVCELEKNTLTEKTYACPSPALMNSIFSFRTLGTYVRSGQLNQVMSLTVPLKWSLDFVRE
jgi:hypothetical protein